MVHELISNFNVMITCNSSTLEEVFGKKLLRKSASQLQKVDEKNGKCSFKQMAN